MFCKVKFKSHPTYPFINTHVYSRKKNVFDLCKRFIWFKCRWQLISCCQPSHLLNFKELRRGNKITQSLSIGLIEKFNFKFNVFSFNFFFYNMIRFCKSNISNYMQYEFLTYTKKKWLPRDLVGSNPRPKKLYSVLSKVRILSTDHFLKI